MCHFIKHIAYIDFSQLYILEDTRDNMTAIINLVLANNIADDKNKNYSTNW